MNFEKDINNFVSNNDKEGLKQYMADHDLVYVDGVIKHKDTKYGVSSSMPMS